MPFKTDIYSIGATVAYAASKEVPDTEDIINGCFEFPEIYSDEFKDFMYFILVKHPDKRPNI